MDVMLLHAEPSQFNIFKGLSAAYVDRFEEVSDFYLRNFQNPEAYKSRLEELDTLTFERETITDVLESYNRSLGCTGKTLENLVKLRNPKSVVVITGQQAGIFTGALYTVYKAITTVKLALSLEKKLGRPVVPVFWIASEDHDFQEIRAAHYLAGGDLKKVEIDKRSATHKRRSNRKKESIGHIETNDSVKDSIEQILSDFSGTEDIQNFEALLRTTFIERESLSNWFGRIMSKLFIEFGLVMIDPMLKDIRALESDFFKCALEKRLDIIEALAHRRDQLKERGFTPSLEFDASGLNQCESSSKSFTYTKETLLREMQERPERFSTNVVLRPVVQDVLFPTLAYVAGPGEINYYGQLGEVYPIFGKQLPVLYPRENFTLVQSDVTDVLKRYDLVPENVLMCGISAIRDHLLDLRDEVRIDELFDTYIEKFEREYSELINKILEISPDLHDLSQKNVGLIKGQMGYLKEKAHRFHRRNHRQMADDLVSIENQLMPGGQIQERELSILQYYAEKGNSLIDFLVQEVPLDHRHRIITLG
jgi:bacillithiol biosynthesis cysteine-adding enzyme BshC